MPTFEILVPSRDQGVWTSYPPYRVGQRVNVLGQDGVVEDIGLRSTRIRLLTGHLTTIPNEMMASVEIENIGQRPHIRRLGDVTITYDRPPEKIERAVEIIREILAVPEGEPGADSPPGEALEAEPTRHPNEAINQPDFPPRVFFNELNADSLNIRFFYWYHPAEYWDFLEHAHHVNVQIMERFSAEGIDFAFPTQTLHLAGDEKRAPITVDQRSATDAPRTGDRPQLVPVPESSDRPVRGAPNPPEDSGRTP